MKSIEKYKFSGLTIKIKQDTDPSNPRKEFDNVGTLVCWHRNYELGDEPEFGGGRRGLPSLDAGEYRLAMAEVYDPGISDWTDTAMSRLWDKAQAASSSSIGVLTDAEMRAYELAELELRQRVGERVQRVLDTHYIVLPVYLYDHSGLAMRVADFGDRWDSGQVGFIYCTREKALREWGNGGLVLSKKRRQQAVTYLTGEIETYHEYLSGQVYGYEIKRKGEGVIDSCWGFYGGVDYVKTEAEAAAACLVETVEA
jgi:hypothetical protein